jgi:hypothetical protein
MKRQVGAMVLAARPQVKKDKTKKVVSSTPGFKMKHWSRSEVTQKHLGKPGASMRWLSSRTLLAIPSGH